MSAEPETVKADTLTVVPAKMPVPMGTMISDMERAWRMSTALAKSGLVPKAYQNKPEDIFAAMQYGAEIGLPPMASLVSVYVVGGKPSLWGDGLLGVIVASPMYQDHDEFFEVAVNGVLVRRVGLTLDDLRQDSTTAVCVFIRKGKATPIERRFSVGQARKANLLGKAGPWQEYPDRMLMMRARGFAGRDAFPDLLRGIRTAEEVLDMPADAETAKLPAPVVRRLSDTPGATIAPPPPASVEPTAPMEIGPAGVVSVRHVMAEDDMYFAVTLDSGQVLETLSPAVAREAEQFVGTDHRVLFTVTRDVVDADPPVEHLDIVSLVVAV